MSVTPMGVERRGVGGGEWENATQNSKSLPGISISLLNNLELHFGDCDGHTANAGANGSVGSPRVTR